MIMRIYIFPILIIIVISVLTATKTTLPEDEPDWMKFRWVGDSLGDQYFDKTRIYLPVNIQGIPHDFTLQFDLGLNVTLVYEPSLRPYLTSYPMARPFHKTSACLKRVTATNGLQAISSCIAFR